MGVNWKGLLGGVAPVLAKALLGPASVALPAVKELSKALLGHDRGSETEVAAALEAGATPEQLAKVAEVEHQFAIRMVELAVQLEQLEAGDRANARAREIATKDRMPALLAVMLSVMVVALLAALAFVAIPEANREPFMLLLGSVSTAWIGAMTYYHGSSSGSRAKDTALARAAGAK